MSTESSRNAAEPIDPVCLFHGKRRSEHVCLYCCLCFEDLAPNTCWVDDEGVKWDVCVPCRQHELDEVARRSTETQGTS